MPYVDFGIWFSCLSGMGWDGKCEIWRVRAYTPYPLSGITSEETRMGGEWWSRALISLDMMMMLLQVSLHIYPSRSPLISFSQAPHIIIYNNSTIVITPL